MYVVPVGPNAAKKFYFYDSASSKVYFSSDGYFAWDVTDNPYAQLKVTQAGSDESSLVAIMPNVPTESGTVSTLTKNLGVLLVADDRWLAKLKFKQPQDDYTYAMWTTDGISMVAAEMHTQTGDVSRAWIVGANRPYPTGLDVHNQPDGAFLGTLFFKPRGQAPIWMKAGQAMMPMATNSLQMAQLGVPKRNATMARKAWFDMILTISDVLPCTFDMFSSVDEVLVSYRNQGQM